jgi:hypothetical protein
MDTIYILVHALRTGLVRFSNRTTWKHTVELGSNANISQTPCFALKKETGKDLWNVGNKVQLHTVPLHKDITHILQKIASDKITAHILTCHMQMKRVNYKPDVWTDTESTSSTAVQISRRQQFKYSKPLISTAIGSLKMWWTQKYWILN